MRGLEHKRCFEGVHSLLVKQSAERPHGCFYCFVSFFLMGENVHNLLPMFMRGCRKTMRCSGQLRFVCHFGQRRRGSGISKGKEAIYR